MINTMNHELKFLNKLKVNIKNDKQVEYNYNLFLKYLKETNVDELVALRSAELLFRNSNVFLEDITLDNINDYIIKTMLCATTTGFETCLVIPMLGYLFKRYLTKDMLNFKDINQENDLK